MESNSEPCLERHFTGHSGDITQICFSPSSNYLASSSLDSSVMIWDLQQAARCIRFSGHTEKVHSVAWAQACNLVVSSSESGLIKIWEPKIRGISKEFIAHSQPVRTVDFDPTGTLVGILKNASSCILTDS